MLRSHPGLPKNMSTDTKFCDVTVLPVQYGTVLCHFRRPISGTAKTEKLNKFQKIGHFFVFWEVVSRSNFGFRKKNTVRSESFYAIYAKIAFSQKRGRLRTQQGRRKHFIIYRMSNDIYYIGYTGRYNTTIRIRIV